eukprot:8128979-Ditylum_brightwellii.AAC.1
MDVYIANMFSVQIRYLRETISISMKGFGSLDCHISAPGFSAKMTIHQWLLMIWTKDQSRQLFTLINVDPNNVYYFCCNKVHRDKAILWLDHLPTLLRTSFLHNNQCLIRDDDDNDPARTYWTEPAENTADAIRRFDEVLNEGMDTVDDSSPDNENKVDEDHLNICWKAPPRSVYSRYSNTTSSSPTAASTVSLVTDSDAPPFTQARTA